MSTSKRLDAFDDSIPVPIEQLIKVSTRRPKRKRAASRIGMSAGPSGHATGGLAKFADPVRVPHDTEPEVFLALPGFRRALIVDALKGCA